jgi:hypothetical protein
VTVPFIPDGGLRELYDTTIGFPARAGVALQPVSVAPLVRVAPNGAEAGCGRADRSAAARAHWLYFYLAWTAPLVLRTIMSGYREPTADERLAVDGWSRTAALPD